MHKRYGLIGKKLSHSFSRNYFTQKFEQLGTDASYHLFELADISEFPALIAREKGLLGLNVTIPYKQAVIAFLDALSPEAADAGAVNTIRFVNGRLIGYNTDIIGFRESLLELLQGNIPKNALILGSGGASQAIKYVLNQLQIDFQVVSREPGKGDITYAALDSKVVSNVHLIVNSTPLGMYPDVLSMPEIPIEAIGQQHHVFDLVYNPTETALLAAAKARGAKVRNGYEMLVLQAEAAWKIWNQPLDLLS